MTDSEMDISPLARAYRRLAPAPLPPDDPEGLAVEGLLEEAFAAVVQAVESSSPLAPVLWTGVAGAGVSTLLGRLAVSDPLAERYYPVPLPLAQSLHLLDARSPDLSFTAYLALVDAAPTAGIEVAPDTLRELVGGAVRRGAVADELRPAHLRRRMRADGRFRATLREELRADPDRLLGELSALVTKFSRNTVGAFRLTDEGMERLRGAEVSEKVLSAVSGLIGRPFRSEVRFSRALEAAMGELQALHYKPLFLKHAWEESPRRPLLLVDDIGKLARGTFESLLKEEIPPLVDSGVKLVAPLPPVAASLLPSMEIAGVALRPVSPTEASAHPSAVQSSRPLRAVLERRLDPRIAPGETLTPLIQASGGLLRELLAHARHALGWIAARGEGCLTPESAEAAARCRTRLRRRFFDGATHGTAARQIGKTQALAGVPAAETDYLLRYGFVLPYGPADAAPWFVPHPALGASGKEGG